MKEQIRIGKYDFYVTKYTVHENASVREALLAKPARITLAGRTFRIKGKVAFYQTGEMYSATLARSAVIYSNAFRVSAKAGATIVFYESGAISSIYDERKKRGTLSGTIDLKENCEIIFGENGDIDEMYKMDADLLEPDDA